MEGCSKRQKMLFVSCQKKFCAQEMLIFVPTFLVMYETSCIRKLRFVSKFMAWETGKQIITIHILPTISRNKGNQIIKLRKLIECNVRNISLGKSYAKCGEEDRPRSFYKHSKLSISQDQQSGILYNSFLLDAQVDVYYQDILN